jgi:photosystem II stability/assembly factor-like uncharacterized protein
MAQSSQAVTPTPTRDGGQIWAAQDAGTTADLSAVTFIDAGRDWAAGETGTVVGWLAD